MKLQSNRGIQSIEQFWEGEQPTRLTNLCEETTKEREKENLDGTTTSMGNVARDGREQPDGLDIHGNMGGFLNMEAVTGQFNPVIFRVFAGQ
jgi:hypothetical protein